MRARWCQGIHINISSKDRGKRRMECRLPDWKKPKLLLNIIREVKERGTFEEPGFHIEAYPKNRGPEFVRRYVVLLSKDRLDELTNNLDSLGSGFFVSRSMYDRISFSYFK